ncbi:hypothetical protein H0H81_008537 [Sphagnurus paluster]|uniref:Uncharacterized protein n=1 Tax=Sphagnurus paluster TaxID=117069 RepID=A0A9P7FWU9_9AGAR|nr:hypothetical protein H0H81_008537 [Sphagnurus paluster]
MATAVAQHAPKVLIHPPASPFAELLRRSKFATYDPAIRQTYSAAPANAHRGDWGLKRPISLRRKNAFISLTSFEHPAHFTEWNHAENQVRFIRRVEEMGVKPETVVQTPWHRSLGKAKTELLLDSDFCPGETSQARPVKRSEEPAKPTAVDLSSLGNKGKGAYGGNREEEKKKHEDEPIPVYVTANVDAMSTREFKLYLKKLRSLRPAFQEHINSHKQLAEKNLFTLAQDAEQGYHRRFMMEHMATEYKDLNTRMIEPQPHPNAALMYARPTPLETRLWTKPKPGIILNEAVVRGQRSVEKKYVVSFGGLGATVRQTNMSDGRTPLLDPASEQGVQQDRIPSSIANLRILPRRGLQLQMPPKVVGSKPQGLKAVKLTAEVVVQNQADVFSQENPMALGSPEYVAAAPRSTKSAPRSFVKAPKLTPRPASTFIVEDRTKLVSTLKTMMKPRITVIEEEL